MRKFRKTAAYSLIFFYIGSLLVMGLPTPVTASPDFDIYDTGLSPPDYNPSLTISYDWQTVEFISGNTYRFKIRSPQFRTHYLVIKDPFTGIVNTYETNRYITLGDWWFNYGCYCWERRRIYHYNYIDIQLDDEDGCYDYFYKYSNWMTEDLWAIYFDAITLNGSTNRYFLDPGPMPSKLGFQIETTYDFTPTPFINYKLINGLGLYDHVSIWLYVDDQMIDSRSTYLHQIGDSIEVVVETELLRQVGTHRIDIQIDNYFHINENFRLGFLKVGNIGFSPREDKLGWGLDLIDAEVVWGGFDGATDVTTNIYGQGIKVLVIDSGIDYNHYDLNDNYYGGYDFIGNDDYPMDGFGHGTRCAGIIASEDNSGGVIGVAPFVKLYIARVYNSYGDPQSWQDFIDAVQWGIYNHVDIISMSFGGYTHHPGFTGNLTEAYNEGITLVAASGNEDGPVSYPANLSNVIAVGAINQTFERISIEGWWGSNYGDGLGIMAPGIDISTTDINNQYMEDFGGTSGACPFVAGTCALILCTNPFLSPLEVRECLYNSANTDSIPDYNFYEYGYGVVDAEAAVNYALTHFPL